MPEIIAIANPKGGGGKTTIAVNLLAAIAQIDPTKKICLFDLDGVASATWWLLGQKGKGYEGPTVVDSLIRNKPLSQVWTEVRPGLFLIPCSLELERVEKDITAIGQITDLLTQQCNDFDYVFLDLSQGFNNIHRTLIAAVDSIYIAAEVDWLSLFGIRGMLTWMQEEEIASVEKIKKVIPTKVDGRPNKTIEIIASLKAAFPGKLSNTIRVCARLGDCPTFHQTIFELSPDSTGAEDFLELARSVLGIEEDIQKPSGRPIGRVVPAKSAKVR